MVVPSNRAPGKWIVHHDVIPDKNDPNFYCGACERRMKTSYYFRTHLINVHKMEFTSYSGAERHFKKRLVAIKQEQIKCSYKISNGNFSQQATTTVLTNFYISYLLKNNKILFK
jgi:hypothetical protein